MSARRFGTAARRRAALTSLILLTGGFAGAASAAKAPPSAAKAPPSAAPMPPSTAKANADQPIDITADRLDVDQNSQLATFSGNVRAVQADITLRTQTLKVYYDKVGKNDPATSTNGAASRSVIRRLEASGGVVIQAPGENARGQRGTYDVVNRVAHLSGDVVLTRGQNVVRGDRLTIDFDSGQSRMEGPEGGKGRVHGVFVPQNSDSGNRAQSGGR
jgi:lipopolysaccharide export system protein LptA